MMQYGNPEGRSVEVNRQPARAATTRKNAFPRLPFAPHAPATGLARAKRTRMRSASPPWHTADAGQAHGVPRARFSRGLALASRSAHMYVEP